MRILINTETRTWTTRERDTSDRWDNGDTAGEVSNVTASPTDREISAYGTSDSLVRELNVGIGDMVYAVVADYESGSTFGRSGGYAQVLDVFTTEEEAGALAVVAESFDADSSNYPFTHEGTGYYREWAGYFERLNSIDVWAVVVKAHPQTFITPAGERTWNRKIGR